MHDLERQMVRIVRRALQVPTSRSPVTGRVLAEVRRVCPDATNAPDREALIHEVARRLCASFAAGNAPLSPSN
jgi:hypothetical protein